MKILLTAINAKYIHSNLAVYSLHAYAAVHGIETAFAEYTINQRPEHIFEDLYRRNPDVLCFSCYIWNIEMVRELAEEYHKLRPQIPIWAGGPEVSFETDAFLDENPAVTGIMAGEGEQTFLELCGYYCDLPAGKTEIQEDLLQMRPANRFVQTDASMQMKPANRFVQPDDSMQMNSVNRFAETDVAASGQDSVRIQKKSADRYGDPDSGKGRKTSVRSLSGIRGLVFRSAGGEHYVHTAPRLPQPMDTFPFVYGREENGELVPNPELSLEHRIIYYETSRGCPFSCSYCLSSVDKRLRFRSLPLVFRELDFFLERKVQQVKFVDRTFNCDRERAMAIWNYLLEHDNGVTNFHFEVAADLITEEEMELIARMRPGLIQLEIGVQSTNLSTIREIHRKMDLDRVKTVVNRIKKGRNVHQHLDLIAGLPEEDFMTFQKSFNEIYNLRPDQLQLGFLKVLKGSYMFDHAEDYGIVSHSRPPYEVLKTRWLSFDDILRIRDAEEMLEKYYNSGQFAVSIMFLEDLFDSAFQMFLELGAWYRKKGLQTQKLSRLGYAEILLDFYQEKAGNLPLGAGENAPVTSEERKSSETGQKRGDGQKEACMKDALLFDLCRIENIKKRPPWAADLRPYRKPVRRYLKEHGLGDKYVRMERFSFLFLKREEKTTSDFRINKRQELLQYVIIDRKKELPEKRSEPFWVLFDYEHRNPLTNEAGIFPVAERSLMQDGYSETADHGDERRN